ncbi:MAG: thioredoxin family protein [Saprospiraceae bacterium]|nr:thioredoxin family protein [Saprospiraceae bacterium]
MKFISTFLLAVLFSIVQLNAQKGIEFFHGTFEEALEESKTQGKLIFVDAYAEWCGPCKRMAATVFKEESVGNYYNSNFINMKIDMEKGEGPALAKKYRVSAYPTFFFIDENGEIVATAKGGRQTEQFIELGENAMKKYDKSGDYTVKYEAGERSPELLRKYAYALLASKKEHLKIANEYFDTQSDFTSEANLIAIYDLMSEADSRIFDLFIEHKAAIIKLKTEEAVLHRIEVACLASVKKATLYKYPSLMEEAKVKMKANYPQKYKEFSIKAEMIYGLGTTDAGLYTKASTKYLKKYAKNNAVEYHNVAKAISTTFGEDAKALKLAENGRKIS